jgi:hypothetical protein
MRELQRKVAFGFAAGFVAIMAAAGVLGFLSLSLFFWLVISMSAAWAAGLTALIILVTAAIAIVILRLAGNARSAPRPQPAKAPGDIAAEIGNLLGQQTRGIATRHTGATILGSLALGFMIGVSPGLRDLLRRGF